MGARDVLEGAVFRARGRCALRRRPGHHRRQVEARDQQVHQRRVERRARVLAQHGHGRARRAGGPVGAVGLQRAVAVGNRQDARAHRNRVAAQARRIAEAVPALVVAEHQVGHRRPELDVAQDLGADARVDLDALELLGRQRLGLGEDVLGHGHVAHVVQQGRGPHALHVAVGEAGGLGQHGRVGLDGAHVLGRAAGLGLDGQRQRLDGLELHLQGAARLFLLFAQARDHGVIAAKHQVERRGQQREPAEQATLPGSRRHGGQRGAGQIAGRAPEEVTAPRAHDRLPRGQRDGARHEGRVHQEVERRHHGRGAHQRRHARWVGAQGQRQRKAGHPHRERQRRDAEHHLVQRVAPAGAHRALRPRADRRNHHRQGRPQREQRPEIHRVRQRQVRLAAAQGQLDLRRRGDHGQGEQPEEQPDILRRQMARGIGEAGRARDRHHDDVGSRHHRQCLEGGPVGFSPAQGDGAHQISADGREPDLVFTTPYDINAL